MVLAAFLPVRKGSERVLQKNTRPFTDSGLSLLQVKLRHLLSLDSLGGIVVSGDDVEAKRQVEEFRNPRIKWDERPEYLCQSNTSISDLSKHAAQVCKADMILWTHVTSPFFTETEYQNQINLLESNYTKGFDSLATVTPIFEFLLDKDFQELFPSSNWRVWPRTQDLEPHYYFNSAVFLAAAESFSNGARLGKAPFFSPCDQIRSYDIDTEIDWSLAQCLARTLP